MSRRKYTGACPVRAAVILSREPGAAYRTVPEITADAYALVAAATAVRDARTAKARAVAIGQAKDVLHPYRATVDCVEGPGGKHELRVHFTTNRYVNGRMSYYVPA